MLRGVLLPYAINKVPETRGKSESPMSHRMMNSENLIKKYTLASDINVKSAIFFCVLLKV